MENKKNLTHNYFYSLLYQLVVITIPIILVPFIAYTLTEEGEGIFSFTQSTVLYFSLLSMLGVQLYGTRKIASVGDDLKQRRKVFWELFTLKIYTTLVSMVLLIITSFFLSHQIIILIQGLFLLANLFDITWFFAGLEEFKMLAFRNSMIRIVSLILVFIFVRTPDDVWKYALITVSCEVVGQMVIWIETKKHHLFKKDFKLLKSAYLDHLKQSIYIFLPQAILILYSNISISMIGFLLGMEDQVSFFNLNLKIINAFLVLITALGSVMIPRVSKLHLDDDYERINDIFKKVISLFAYLSLPMCVGFIFIADAFVPMFLSEAYTPSIPVLQILSVKLIFASFVNVVAIQFIVPTGQNKKFIVGALIGLVFNLVFGVILVLNFAAIGAAIITVLTELVILICFLVMTNKQIPLFKYILKSYKSLIAVSIMVIALLALELVRNDIFEILHQLILSQRFVNLGYVFIQMICGVIVYLVSSLILKNDIQSLLFEKIKGIIKLVLKIKPKETSINEPKE